MHYGYDFGPWRGGGSETNCLTVIRGVFPTHTSKVAKVFLFCSSLCLYGKLILQISPTRCTILLNVFISLLYVFRASMCPS